SLAISLILAILSEMIVSNDGLGYFTLLAERTFKVPDMYAGIFTLAMFGYALNRLFLLGEAKIIRWHQESSGPKYSQRRTRCLVCGDYSSGLGSPRWRYGSFRGRPRKQSPRPPSFA